MQEHVPWVRCAQCEKDHARPKTWVIPTPEGVTFICSDCYLGRVSDEEFEEYRATILQTNSNELNEVNE